MIENPNIRLELKFAIAVAGLLMALVCCWLKRRDWPRARSAAAGILVVLGLFSIVAYFEFGYFRYGRYLNPHDVFHYYIGAKYSPEVDYGDLYRTALVADMEGRRVYRKEQIRDLDTHGYESVKTVLARAEQYKKGFTSARWEEFKKDIRFFQSIMPAGKWNEVLNDKGYNATPVWNAVARFLTRFAPTDGRIGMNAIIALDPIFLAVTLAVVAWAFGWESMLFVLIFFASNFMLTFVHIRGAFMRFDWIACLVISTCLLYRRYYKTAGAFMAYSAMARVFPAIFLYGLGIKFGFTLLEHAREYWKTRKIPVLDDDTKRYLGFFITFAVVALLLVGMSILADGDAHRWGSFAKKISVHNNDISTTRVGFKYIFLAPYQHFMEKVKAFDDHRVLWRALMLMFLLALVWPARRIEDFETIPYSYAAVYFLTAPTFYYHVMLVVPLLLFAPKLHSWARAGGLAGLFALSSLSYVFYSFVPFDFRLSLILSVLILIFVCGLVAVAIWNSGVSIKPAAPLNVPAPLQGLGRFLRGLLREKTWILAGGIVLAGCFVLWAAARAGKPATPSSGNTPSAMKRSPVPPGNTSSDAVLALAGDVMLARNVAETVKQHGGDYTYPFLNIADYIHTADMAMCNLECPVTTRGDRVSKNYMFRAAPESLSGLTFAGFTLVTLANNHVLDFGTVGLQDTVDNLTKNRIQYVGLSTNEALQQPIIREIKGVKIGFLAYADPAYPYSYAKEYLAFPTRPAKGDPETVRADIVRLRPNVDVIVVTMHWGVEYVQRVDTHQKEFGHLMIDAGADIVAAHHPHVQQPAERYRRGLIIYSMGNFVFDQHQRPPTRESRLYRVYVNKKGFVRGEYLPLEITDKDWQPTPTSAEFVPITGGASPE